MTQASRRLFLKQSGCTLSAFATPWLANLTAFSQAQASTPTDYKALVCVFLNGGNDHANTVVPSDTTHYGIYSQVRAASQKYPAISVTRESLHALSPLTPLDGGRSYGLSPHLPKLAAHFNAERMAIVLNVGPLTDPTITPDDMDELTRLPPKLYSHNDQTSLWQSTGTEGTSVGWGGQFIDAVPSSGMFKSVNVQNAAVFPAGPTTKQYQTTPTGAIQLQAQKDGQLNGSADCALALQDMIKAGSTANQGRTHVLETHYLQLCGQALTDAVTFNGHIATARNPLQDTSNPFPSGNPLADQLLMVAKAITMGQELAGTRQVFMVALDGFDTHNNLLKTHAKLLPMLDNALDWFYKALVYLQVDNRVVTFTASDFGRSLVPNNDGSDHGWGGMHFVLGSGVAGKQFYGTPPAITYDTGSKTVGGADNAGNGRLIPRVGVAEYAATLGHWFDVPSTTLNAIFPELSAMQRPVAPYLNFMKPVA